MKRIPSAPPKQETWVRPLGLENPLEEEMATHSSTSAWRIPRTKEPSCPQSRVSQRVGHDRATNTHCIFIYSKKYTSLNLLTSIRNHYLRCLTNLPFLYFLFMYMCSVVFHSPRPHGLQFPGSSVHVTLLQEYWSGWPPPPRDPNPHLQHCRRNPYH